LKVSAARYRQAYGLPAPKEQDDPAFGARLAWFEGTPAVLAAPLDTKSWIAQRIERFGEGPCAFILSARKSKSYRAASKARWFGSNVSWFDAAQLGWHLGFED
jgi:hypothetical protein